MQKTEMRNPKTTHIDKMDTASMIKIINEENYNSVKAVENASEAIAKAIDIVTDAFEKGGRLIYVGAGTSGRLAVSDAAECPPTYGVEYGMVEAIIAGGEKAIVRAQENVEDQAAQGEADILAKNITAKDVVMGISASGNASYVVSAMEAAKKCGATLLSLSSNEDCRIGKISDVHIFTDTGAEVVTGSTRMKAGNAQKMVLNMLTTCAMIKTGKVYENFMINLKPTNVKLRARMIGIVSDICSVDGETSEKLLEENEFSIRKAVDAFGK